jgi:hypothetical protein
METRKDITVEVILAYETEDDKNICHTTWACCLCPNEQTYEDIDGHLLQEHGRRVRESSLTYGILIERRRVPYREVS